MVDGTEMVREEQNTYERGRCHPRLCYVSMEASSSLKAHPFPITIVALRLSTSKSNPFSCLPLSYLAPILRLSPLVPPDFAENKF